ncbi:MAG TPA: DinB family protein [Candidatus Dormibacteraeota bacterium]|nr:DinB family protein [Candidatus Dormibacteraeota bacterium]
MNAADQVRLMVAYDGWATDRLLLQTGDLVELGTEAVGGASHGSIEGSIRHVLESTQRWLERFTGAPCPLPEGAGFEALAIAAGSIRDSLTAFAAGLSDPDLYEEVSFEDSQGNLHHDYLGVLLAHVINHGTYHRGEAALLLTRIGRSPGDLDLTVYRRMMEPGR